MKKTIVLFGGLLSSITMAQSHSHGVAGELEHGLPMMWVLLGLIAFGLYTYFKPTKK